MKIRRQLLMDTKDEAKTNTKPATVAISGKTRQAAEQAAATWRVATVIRKTAGNEY